MALKKADLEDHHAQYQSLMAEARQAEHEGLYRTAVKLAIQSWEFIDGMMQYERRYQERAFDSIDAIDMVLRYAPVLLDFRSLDTLEQLLKDTRRIEKNTDTNLANKLARARDLMWNAHRLWAHLERHPQFRQDELRRTLGGDQDEWRAIAEAWDKMGLICRIAEGTSYRLSLSTRMGEVVPAKCPSCGVISQAPKAVVLEEMNCPDCRARVAYVLLAKAVAQL